MEEKFWSLKINNIFDDLASGNDGSSSHEAISMLEIYGHNAIELGHNAIELDTKIEVLDLIFSQLMNSIVLLLVSRYWNNFKSFLNQC